jgi:hypothetical protein
MNWFGKKGTACIFWLRDESLEESDNLPRPPTFSPRSTAVQMVLDRHHIAGVRFDRDEGHLQTETAVPWLDPVVSNPGTLSILLQPFPSELMDTYEVSRLVNDPRNDSGACIAPADWNPAL